MCCVVPSKNAKICGLGYQTLGLDLFVGAFAKLRKATISFIMSVRPSVRLSCSSELLLGSHWTDFHEILYFNIFRKSVENSQVS
jgi:hypothetical protein